VTIIFLVNVTAGNVRNTDMKSQIENIRKPATLKECIGQQFKLTEQRSFLLFLMSKLFHILGGVTVVQCRSQWPRGLTHELSSLARTLGSCVQIPLKAWMSVCVYSVFVLFRV
jgi:hypothetical protein